MVDVLDEIEFLKNVLIAMREGASDEKRMMMDAIEIVSTARKTWLQTLKQKSQNR